MLKICFFSFQAYRTAILGPLAFTAMCLPSCHHWARLRIKVTLDQFHNSIKIVVNLNQKINIYLSIYLDIVPWLIAWARVHFEKEMTT